MHDRSGKTVDRSIEAHRRGCARRKENGMVFEVSAEKQAILARRIANDPAGTSGECRVRH